MANKLAYRQRSRNKGDSSQNLQRTKLRSPDVGEGWFRNSGVEGRRSGKIVVEKKLW